MTESERLAALLKAIEFHQELTLDGKLSADAINHALWLVAEMVRPKCDGGCCG